MKPGIAERPSGNAPSDEEINAQFDNGWESVKSENKDESSFDDLSDIKMRLDNIHAQNEETARRLEELKTARETSAVYDELDRKKEDFEGETNTRVDSNGVEHERTNSKFDLYPHQKGESAADYGARLRWQRHAEEIMENTPREEGESLEDYNKRVKEAVGTIEDFKAAENAKTPEDPLAKMRASLSRIEKIKEDADKRADISDILSQSTKTENKEESEDAEKLRSENLSIIRSRNALKYYVELGIKASEVESYSGEQLAELRAKIDAKSAEQTKTAEQPKAATVIELNGADKEENLEKAKRILRKIAAKAVETNTVSSPDEIIGMAKDAEQSVAAEMEEESESEKLRAENLAFIRSRKAVKYFGELGIKASEIKDYSDEKLSDLRASIEAKINDSQNEVKEPAKVTPIEQPAEASEVPQSTGEFANVAMENLNTKLERQKQQIWELNQKLQTAGFFQRRKIAKQIAALNADRLDTERRLAAEISKKPQAQPGNYRLNNTYASRYYDQSKPGEQQAA